jgi:hypothetical protein
LVGVRYRLRLGGRQGDVVGVGNDVGDGVVDVLRILLPDLDQFVDQVLDVLGDLAERRECLTTVQWTNHLGQN